MLSHTIYSCPSVICSPAQLLILAGNTPTFGSQETCKKIQVEGYISRFVWILWHLCLCMCRAGSQTPGLSKGTNTQQSVKQRNRSPSILFIIIISNPFGSNRQLLIALSNVVDSVACCWRCVLF